MQIDKETLQKLLSLDDRTFKTKIQQAAQTSGIKDERLNKVLNDAGTVKRMLSTMTESDLKRLSTFVGGNKLEDVLKNLQKSMKN